MLGGLKAADGIDWSKGGWRSWWGMRQHYQQHIVCSVALITPFQYNLTTQCTCGM